MNTYEVRVKATIEKQFTIYAESHEDAEREAMELFNPHSGECEDRYTQEVVSCQQTSLDTDLSEEDTLLALEAAWFAAREHSDALGEYLDLADAEIESLKQKLDTYLNGHNR